MTIVPFSHREEAELPKVKDRCPCPSRALPLSRGFAFVIFSIKETQLLRSNAVSKQKRHDDYRAVFSQEGSGASAVKGSAFVKGLRPLLLI